MGNKNNGEKENEERIDVLFITATFRHQKKKKTGLCKYLQVFV